MRPGQQRGINNDDLQIFLGHTNDAIARETVKQMGMKVTDTRGYCDGCGEAKAIRRAVPRKMKVKSGRPLQRVFIDPTGPYPPSRAPFVWDVSTWGSGAVMDAAAAAAAPTAATVTGNGVFHAASTRGAEGAPASGAVAASTVTGSEVFPAASARGAAGAPASAAVAAASAAATATAAAAVVAAAIPPDGARKTAAARGGVSSTLPVDWTTTRHNQPPRTATTQRRRHQVTPAVTRSRSRRTGMSGAFALLEADEQIVRSLATGTEADGDPELPAALVCDLDARNVRAHLEGGGAQGVCRTWSNWDV